MALTVRLSPQTERVLSALARRKRMSRSDVVREALAHYEAGEVRAEAVSGQYEAWVDALAL